jgi:hypothetical protein
MSVSTCGLGVASANAEIGAVDGEPLIPGGHRRSCPYPGGQLTSPAILQKPSDALAWRVDVEGR